MKKLTLILLVISTFSYSQKMDLNSIPKNTSKIILTNKLAKSENFNYIIELLLDNDFTISKKNKEYGTIKTDSRSIKKMNGSYFLNVRIKNNKIFITGKLIVNLSIDLGSVESQPDWSEIINKGMKGSAYKNSFEHMYEFSQLIDYTKIQFE